MTTKDDDDIESSVLVVDRILVGPTTTDMAADVAPTTTFRTVDFVTDIATTDQDKHETANDKLHSSSSCPCTGCTLTADTTASSSSRMMNLCPLVRDGCRACYGVYYDHYWNRHGGDAAAPPQTRPCLFHACSIQSSRIVKDDVVLELDRILSANQKNVSTTTAASDPSNDSPPPDVLPIGTIVLCCWYLNGVRIF